MLFFNDSQSECSGRGLADRKITGYRFRNWSENSRKKAGMWQKKQPTRGNNVLQVGQSLATKLAVNVELSHPNVETIPVSGQILFSDTQQDLKVIKPFYFVKSLLASWSVAGHGDSSYFCVGKTSLMQVSCLVQVKGQRCMSSLNRPPQHL